MSAPVPRTRRCPVAHTDVAQVTLNRKRPRPPKPAYSLLRAITEVSVPGVAYNEIIRVLRRTPEPQKLLDTPYVFTFHINYLTDDNLQAQTLFDLIRIGFVYTHEYTTLRVLACYYRRLHLILRPWRFANHHSRPLRIRHTARTMFALRCVKDNIVGALPPEVLQIIMYFVL